MKCAPYPGDMDSSHSARHTSTQPQSLHSQGNAQSEILQETPPPSKRRRANSANPSAASTAQSATTPSQTDHRQLLTISTVNNTTDRPLSVSISRSNSLDHASHVSSASSLPSSGPQLRKKPKSSSIKNTNNLRVAPVAILTSPSLPAFHTPSQPVRESSQNRGSVYGITGPSTTQPNLVTPQNISPNQKRQPASHSSYGVETICGPPPSYSTQRTLSQERIRKIDRNTQSRVQPVSSDQAQMNVLDDTNVAAKQRREDVTVSSHSSPESADTLSIPTPTETENMNSINIRGNPRASAEEETKAPSSDGRRSEDLFLNIARVDAARLPPAKTEKRRSRISIPFLPGNRPVKVINTASTQPQIEQIATSSQRADVPVFHNKRASLGARIAEATSSRNHLLDAGRFRDQFVDNFSDNERDDGRSFVSGLRRSSTTNNESTKLTHRSSAGLRGNRLNNTEIIPTELTKTSEHIATESTISTGAPSTVWDELDDLKSRIRKLELTGKLPSSSAAAMGSAERPRTATTAATTMSTSPKYKTSEPNLEPAIESTSSNIHPLLHEALNHAKAVVSHDVYQKLQATANDALQLAAMMSGEGNHNASYATPLSNERQIRRRTESMCRGLTELAIVLAAEAKPTQSVARPLSRDQSLPPNSMLRSRRYSNDPADRSHAPPRVQSRLDSRRVSVHLGRASTGYSSPEHGPYQSPGPITQPSDPRLNRSSTLLRKRGQGSFDGTDEQYDASPSIRPGSRAMTDLGAYRRLSREQLQSPREYISQYPLPSQEEHAVAMSSVNTPLPPSQSMTFTSRRKYASPASTVGMIDSSPITPREAWGRIATGNVERQPSDVLSEVGASTRLNASRRSLGFAGRIGSSVGNRLRAARYDRNGRDDMPMREGQDMIPLERGNHTIAATRVDMQAGGDVRRI